MMEGLWWSGNENLLALRKDLKIPTIKTPTDVKIKVAYGGDVHRNKINICVYNLSVVMNVRRGTFRDKIFGAKTFTVFLLMPR